MLSYNRFIRRLLIDCLKYYNQPVGLRVLDNLDGGKILNTVMTL